MTRSRRFLAAACVMTGVAALAGGSSMMARLSVQQPVFRAGVDLVSFGVTVTDGRGNYITDLEAKDFEILEEGEPQTITYFARGSEAAPTPDLHVGLLFDTSGSMDENIRLARSAAVRFLNTLTDAVDMTLVDFATEVRVATFGQQDFPRLVERIRNRRPAGWTAMYDALGVYLDGAAGDEGRTILVVYTDGGDTRSTISFGDVMTLVRASDVTIHAVGFLEHQSSRTRLQQRVQLMQIAEATGGLAFFPSSMKDVEMAYGEIVAQIRAQYSLGYVSTNTSADGQWREVEIRVRRAGVGDARIQSRKGYFAPYREP